MGTEKYTCHACDFSTDRVNSILAHRKGHMKLKGMGACGSSAPSTTDPQGKPFTESHGSKAKKGLIETPPMKTTAQAAKVTPGAKKETPLPKPPPKDKETTTSSIKITNAQGGRKRKLVKEVAKEQILTDSLDRCEILLPLSPYSGRVRKFILFVKPRTETNVCGTFDPNLGSTQHPEVKKIGVKDSGVEPRPQQPDSSKSHGKSPLKIKDSSSTSTVTMSETKKSRKRDSDKGPEDELDDKDKSTKISRHSHEHEKSKKSKKSNKPCDDDVRKDSSNSDSVIRPRDTIFNLGMPKMKETRYVLIPDPELETQQAQTRNDRIGIRFRPKTGSTMARMMETDSDWRDSCPTNRDKHLHALNSGEFSDVIFLVGENEVPIHAHKLILVFASPVFEIQFNERWNKENFIRIPDVTPKAFQLFLKFLYTEEFSMNEEEAEEVLSVAHKYMTKSLVKKCCEFLESVINVTNVINIHRIGAKFGTAEDSLQQKAMEFILANGRSVLQDIGFLGIDPYTLSMILKDDKLCSDEITIFRALMRWAENRCQVEKLDCTVQNKRIISKDLIHLIRFTRMTSQDFMNEVHFGKHEGILSDAESVGIFKHLIAEPPKRSLLPTLPFNLNIRHGGLLHKIGFIEPGLRNSSALPNCRVDFRLITYNTSSCEKTFQFRSNRCISVKAIELRQSIYTRQLRNATKFLIFNGSGSGSLSSEVIVSMSSSLHENRNMLSGQFLPVEIPPDIKSLNGFRIEKDKNYNIKLVIASIGGITDVSSGAGLSMPLSTPVQVAGKEDVQVTYTTDSSQCHIQRQSGRHSCICSGQIKTIYFTFD